MIIAKRFLGFAATAFIAGGVAYSVSAPRNVENAMNEPMAQLGGSTIAQEIKSAKDNVRSEQCIKYRELASEQWERSLEQDRIGDDSSDIDYLDRQIELYCD